MTTHNLTDELKYSVSDGVATLAFNRPHKSNACTTTMYNGIVQVADEVRNNDAVKVLILTGEGGAFCAGSDSKERLDKIARGESLAASRWELIQPVGYFGAALYNISKPTIAAVNGICAGAGLSFALLCDFRIASEKARFSAVWVRMGLVPDAGATYLLPRIVGMDKALELCFTGDVINATEAERISLVTKVVSHDKLMPSAFDLARKIAEGPAVAIELTRKGLYAAMNRDYFAQLDYESYAQNKCFQTADFHEAVSAFQKKRKPQFQGR